MAACTPHPHPVWFQSLGNLPISLHTSSRSQPPLSISTPTSSASSHTGFRSEESTFQNLRLFPREKMGGGGARRGRGAERKARSFVWKYKSCHIPHGAGVQQRETSERPWDSSSPMGTPPSVLILPRCCSPFSGGHQRHQR